METTLGGERLGSGNKQKIQMRNYERSTHDLNFVKRTSMAPGVLVPFWNEIGLPGDTFDIKLDTEIITLPTLGPCWGSMKVQLDVFTIPFRLYQGKLHMNMLNIGRNMSAVKLPLIKLIADRPSASKYGAELDNFQIEPSTLFAYLGIRGVGNDGDPLHETNQIMRKFCAIGMLSYWDIYKNYYANKQEEIGVVIHNDLIENDYTDPVTTELTYAYPPGSPEVLVDNDISVTPVPILLGGSTTDRLRIIFTDLTEINPDTIYISNVTLSGNGEPFWQRATELFDTWTITTGAGGKIDFTNPKQLKWIYTGSYRIDNEPNSILDTRPKLSVFPLENIDKAREAILKAVDSLVAVEISADSLIFGDLPPYNLILKHVPSDSDPTEWVYSMQSKMEGLGCKTYQSDLFNNWISTEWLDGENGVNAITAVQVDEDGKFTIDLLTLRKKIYDMLNRIALSGGTYDDWLDATYTHERHKSIENPMYVGGLSKELKFQEVISTAQAQGENGAQPLGTLAGRGQLTNKHKGGEIYIKIDEPSYIMGIISLTPRLDYSQGNRWFTNLLTMDDLHKPPMDEIGFQDLITDQMAWWDTGTDQYGQIKYRSAGKQPAWINYMTNYNEALGNFARENDSMFMTFNRRYEPVWDTADSIWSLTIKDLTTYIDPSKFNYIFADTRIDAQNFLVHIGGEVTARRKMSARVIPNL